MARRRYLSTTISQDIRVNKLAIKYGDFAVLLYTWMIPHAADDASLPGDPEELLYQVLPGRRDKSPEDVQAALDGMAALGLIATVEGGRLRFPTEAFYRYQTYIKDRNKQRDDEPRESAPETPPPAPPSQPEQTPAAEQRKSAQDSAEPRTTAQKAVSFSPSSSSSFSPPPSEDTISVRDDPAEPNESPPDGGELVRAVPKPTTLNRQQQARFDRWYLGAAVPEYPGYPNKQHRPDAEKAWRKVDPDDAMTERLIADVVQRKRGRKWLASYIELPATYLNNRVWEDDIEPMRIKSLPHNHPDAARRVRVYD